MQCKTTREQILTPVTHAERSVGKNPTLPVLSCILLEVSEHTLSCSATNLEVGLRATIPVSDGEDGKTAVPGSVLAQVLSALPQGAQVTLRTEGTHLMVESASGRARVSTQDAEDFPVLPSVENGVDITLPQRALVETLSSVAHCASASSIKPELASVFVLAQNGTLTAAATDSFRLAEKKFSLKSPASADAFLVPARSVQDLLRILEPNDEPVTLSIGEHQLSLEANGVFLTLRLTAGTFPDYTQIIPKEFYSEATMLVADFERALKKASIFSDRFNQMTITASADQEYLEVHTENSSVGDTTDRVPATLTGEPVTISFNQRYVQDAFGPIATDSFVFAFTNASRPAVIRPVGDESYRYLVMPMNR